MTSSPLTGKAFRNSRSWTRLEDDELRRVVPIYMGGKLAVVNKSLWLDVAEYFEHRSPKQVRERWKHYIDPSIKQDSWDQAEDDLLISLQGIHGNKWADIADLIPGRTDNGVKNRYKLISNAKSRREPKVR